ncbi:predicted protein [Histoplasma capsulatum G186AR]|uniref:Thioesterase domain-containing protein n=2 Tax=Ajellomyces capsulatus TaxID=5037 RepID=C0NRD1_AJECG|nr:uncharacterized protein HCBG_05561 [Histoplasma capsulatum G186AR]EEH06245.1 predicted protein [Histoplasma capsulatum G186AR]KAG5293297.1 thioesterase domain, hot dog superfamily domain-containing protein [Histoplasma capsulatum]QSS74748.1 thioesterase domain, hot dog superfamily domain-containing protein [Histoplasma capsulatum G186AR]
MGTNKEKTPWDKIQSILNTASAYPETSSWDASCMKAVKLVKVEPSTVEFEFTVTGRMCNSLGILHGGCSTTILDVLTSAAVLSVPGSDPTLSTLSRTLTVTFLRPIPVGTKVRVVVQLVAAGKKFVNFTGSLLTMDGKVCASCVHDKAVFRQGRL